MLGLTADSPVHALSALSFLDDKVPNEEAIALSPLVGWVMLAGVLAAASLFILNSEWWRRWWLSVEDPRSMGLYRIVFGLFVICNMNDFWEYFEYLFTDEGIFTADVARQVFAAQQFEGFGDGFSEDDPWGFFDMRAFFEFLKGPKYSLLLIWDSPTFFWAHLWAFEICAALFMIGFWTRTTGILTLLLMNSIFFRNHLFWEGTELVYRVFLVYLICAKSGHAYSFDNWWRCRKLRKRGLLSERDGPGGGAGVPPSDDHPQGLAAIYRLIPSWPRQLAMLQLAVVYITTGVLKNGHIWSKGDAIYYAWNLDHFYRFYPQPISALFGTNVLRVVTWTTHWGESLFCIVILGVLTRWASEVGVPRARGWQKAGMFACWAAIIAVSAALIWITWSVHFAPQLVPGAWAARIGLSAEFASAVLFVAGWLALCLGLWWLWIRLDRKPFMITVQKIYKIDRAWVGRWILGRRIWITWHIALMGGIFFLMNIGQFQTGMLAQTFVFLSGLETAIILRAIGRRLAKWRVPGIPEDVKRGEPPIPSEDPSLPHLRRDAARLPQWSLFATMLIFLIGVIVRAVVQPKWEWRWIWAAGVVFLAGVAVQRWMASRRDRLSEIDPRTDKPRAPWAYGPFGRFTIGGLIVWHLIAVATWLLPDKDCLQTWRPAARQVFAKWLTTTQTDQGWGMFAPNPPRSNVFLKVLVTDQNDEAFDMKTDVYAPERKPIPWIWNDRLRKMNRRIIGGESGNSEWYRKWHARYYCRKWAMDHDGEAPKKVELVKVWYRIPSPEETREKGWYRPETLLEKDGAQKVEHEEHCERTVMGQLPDWIRERHGLPPLPEGQKYRPWIKNKKKKWDRKLEREREREEREAAAKDGTQAEDVPRQRAERRKDRVKTPKNEDDQALPQAD